MENDSMSGTMKVAITAAAVTITVLGVMFLWNHYPPGARMMQMGGESDDEGSENPKLMFFYTTWCPHCHKAQPVWKSLKGVKRSYGGKKINFEEIDCDADKGKAAMYKIEGYPTFKLETRDKVYQFKGKPDVPSLRAFLTTALGEEKDL
jgi:thiol-disulfide isomerase/thioredoxin